MSYVAEPPLSDLDTHSGRHVAWWWVEGGSEGEDRNMVWEPLYNRRHRWEAVQLMRSIDYAIEQQTAASIKEDLVFYDDFRIRPEYVPERYERRSKVRQEPTEDDPGPTPSPEASTAKEGRKRKAKRLIREALAR